MRAQTPCFGLHAWPFTRHGCSDLTYEKPNKQDWWGLQSFWAETRRLMWPAPCFMQHADNRAALCPEQRAAVSSTHLDTERDKVKFIQQNSGHSVLRCTLGSWACAWYEATQQQRLAQNWSNTGVDFSPLSHQTRSFSSSLAPLLFKHTLSMLSHPPTQLCGANIAPVVHCRPLRMHASVQDSET